MTATLCPKHEPRAAHAAPAPGSPAQPRVEELYAELHRLAAGLMRDERTNHTLQPSAVVHEAYLRIRRQEPSWETRAHLLTCAATTMRRVLVDHARARTRWKRGGLAQRQDIDLEQCASREPDEHHLAVHEALEALARIDPAKARFVELRFFGGLDVQQCSTILGRSTAALTRDWRFVRAWIRDRIDPKEAA